MPELPEVETIRRGLSTLLIDQEIESVDFDWPKSFPNSKQDVDEFLVGAKVSQVKRRAKVLLIELSSQYSLVIHLKMTGQLVYRSSSFNFGAGHPSDSLLGLLPDKSTRIIIKFTNNSQLFFNDQRKFGWMRLMPTSEIVNLDFFKKVGPEPLASDFNWQVLKRRLLKRPRSSIKAVILDQTVIAGIGNIYADESLWGAKIHPLKQVIDLRDIDIKRLYKEIVFVLNLSIEKGGSTDRNYLNAEGKKGSYLSFARVFRRQNMPCPRCNHLIQKIRVASRGTHICPYCQRID